VFLSLAYAAEDNDLLAWLVYVALGLVDFVLLTLGAAYSATLLTEPPATAGSGLGAFDPALLTPVGPIFLTLGVLGFIMLYPPFRRPFEHVTLIDSGRIVHVVALHYALLLGAVSAAVAVFVSAAVDNPDLMKMLEEGTRSGGLAALWEQNLAFAAVGFLGVGLFVRRDLAGAAQRLGLEPRIRLGYAVMVPIVGLLSGYLIDMAWRAASPAGLEQVQRISDALFQPYMDAGLIGAITVGLSAGIGEEILFRGAAQPRLGLALTAFLFAVLHTQYTVSPALIQVFVVGLALGVTRIRSNTTTSIVGHALYNFILVAMAIYAPQLGP
jgi:hypothetical protein